jgi:hypothetical protein
VCVLLGKLNFIFKLLIMLSQYVRQRVTHGVKIGTYDKNIDLCNYATDAI